MQRVQPPFVALNVMAHAGGDRSENGKQQDAGPDIIAVFVHETLFGAVDVGGGAWMRRERRILVGVGFLDLDRAWDFSRE
jgi:hypothetical protein